MMIPTRALLGEPGARLTLVRYALTGSLDPGALTSHWTPALTPDELARASSFRDDRDRRDYLAAHVLARLCIAEAWDRDPGQALPEDRAGWSLSHARGLVCCAILPDSKGSVGIDTERLDSLERLATMTDVVSPGAGERDIHLVHVWVAKEAYLKSRGTGFSGPAGLAVLRELVLSPDRDVGGWSTLQLRDRRSGTVERVWLRNVGEHVISVVSAIAAPPLIEERLLP